MSYEVFQTKVNALIERAGGNIYVRFSTDPASGRHYAKCSDGTSIVGNSSCKRVEVRWGQVQKGVFNHRSLTTI